MTPERWQQIRNVLEDALVLTSEMRRAYLDRACASDQSLRREVESLLGADDEARTSFLQSPPPRVQLEKGARLGDYEIQSLLGAGGMGEVYRARDLRLRRDVAVKVLPTFFSSDNERMRRFEQEAQAAAALNDPNILAVFQMGTYEGAPYLVSELLEGDTLRVQISRGPMMARKAIEYGVQIAHGLASAHDKGIIHRDLKPENLFATRDGRIKILDFGLAKLKQPEPNRQHGAPTAGVATEPGMVMGTAGYMSPEQVRGKEVDHRTDIFAFGAILYEMLTGKRAFHKTTSVDTMSAILNEEPAPVSQVAQNVPPALQRTVHRCLEKSPERRFQSASDLAFALEALSDSQATPLPTKAEHRPAKSGWRLAGLSTAAVMVVAVLLFWAFLPERVPVVEAMTQLTDDGEPKNSLQTDGLRLYFNQGPSSAARIAQVAVTGGQTAIVPNKWGQGEQLIALAPDASALLIMSPEARFWLLPIPAGEPKPLDLKNNGSSTADFFPDGRIIHTLGRNVLVAQNDGSSPQKIAEVPGMALGTSVSPDGKRIGVTVIDDRLRPSQWEMASDGSGLHQLLEGWPGSLGEWGGGWTPDGKYYIVQSQRGGRSDLWALPEHRSLFGKASSPVRLTNGPISYDNPIASRDGKKLFAVGSKARGELVRYDARTRQFVSYLSGISAVEPTVSRDGKWIAYVSYPDHTLWRSNADGSGRVQLTFPPMMVFYPQISPHGTKIAFSGLTEAGLALFVMDVNTGAMAKFPDFGHGPSWSPDGNSLAYTAIVAGKHLWDEGTWCEIHIVDLSTRKITVLADPTDSKYAPWWPAPNQVVAFGVLGQAHLYDLKSGKWSALGSVTDPISWTPSLDRTSLLLLVRGPDGMRVVRMRSPDFKIETVADVGSMRLVEDGSALGVANSGQWIGITPDGSFALTRDVGSSEIYALDVKWP